MSNTTSHITACPRPEYPRPQFVRERWINLNGTWTCELDHSRSGYDPAEIVHGGTRQMSRRLWLSQGFAQSITVPFCPESALSGVGYTDFIGMMWYHRTIEIPPGWDECILLHFGAVDYRCDVFIDGRLVGRHAGGQCGFAFEIARFVRPGSSHNLVLCVRDDVRGYVQPSGKQSSAYHSHDCHYTRVTGIWQTVWMEPVAACSLVDVHILPDLDGGCFHLIPAYRGLAAGNTLNVTLGHKGEQIAEVRTSPGNGLPISVPIPDPQPWAPGSPHLYDIELEILDHNGSCIDRVACYAGLRKIHIEGNRVFLNNQPLYQRLVLDQGYYPDGIWTAPSDAALRRDIELSMAAGFNGARLHQKVFEPRFHYWADKLGYLTWGEASSWGCNAASFEGRDNFLSEWREILLRDRNHPSIITWTPWNEMWWIQNEEEFGRTLRETYQLTKALDSTRPVHTASGGAHCLTDIWSLHSYEQTGPALARAVVAGHDRNLERSQKDLGEAAPYAGQPVMLDEFGGIKWKPADQNCRDDAWGYGDAPQTIDAFYQRLEELLAAVRDPAATARRSLISDPEASLPADQFMPEPVGYCYTQLTDVEQEVNGIYTYERKPKFDMERIRATFKSGLLKRFPRYPQDACDNAKPHPE